MKGGPTFFFGHVIVIVTIAVSGLFLYARAGGHINDFQNTQPKTWLVSVSSSGATPTPTPTPIPDTAAPAGVALFTPSDGAIYVNLPVTLSVTVGTDATPPIKYQFEWFDNDTCGGAPMYTTEWSEETAAYPGGLDYGAVYSWRAQAKDSVVPTPNSTGWVGCYWFSTEEHP